MKINASSNYNLKNTRLARHLFPFFLFVLKKRTILLSFEIKLTNFIKIIKIKIKKKPFITFRLRRIRNASIKNKNIRPRNNLLGTDDEVLENKYGFFFLSK